MPYRQPAEMVVYVEVPIKRFGLIVVPASPPKPVKKSISPPLVTHTCKLPKPDLGSKKHWWQYFSNVIEKPPVVLKTGDLWRCEECHQVYMCRLNLGDIYGPTVHGCIHECIAYCDYWVKSTLSVWEANGGEP